MLPANQTTEIDSRPLAQFVLNYALMTGDIDWYLPDSIDEDQVYDGLTVKNVHSIDSDGDSVEVVGDMIVSERVGRIPAGPNRGYGPINPPEILTEDREVGFMFRFTFVDEGEVAGEVEVL